MNPKPILVAGIDCVDRKTLTAIRRAGYIVIETPNLNAVRFISAPPTIPIDNIAQIAVDVLSDDNITDHLVREVFQRRLMKAAVAAFNKIEA